MPEPGSGTGSSSAIRGGAGMNGLPLKLYSAKSSREPLTEYRMGGTDVCRQDGCQTHALLCRILLNFKCVSVKRTLKNKIRNFCHKGSERVTLGSRPTKVNRALPDKRGVQESHSEDRHFP